jgi:hypothetical protein
MAAIMALLGVMPIPYPLCRKYRICLIAGNGDSGFEAAPSSRDIAGPMAIFCVLVNAKRPDYSCFDKIPPSAKPHPYLQLPPVRLPGEPG